MTETENGHYIEAVAVNKSFGSNHVLRDVNLTVRKGETFVIVGASGCGKSVFLKHLVGLLTPDSGEIRVLGRNIHALSPAELLDLRKRVGMVFQSSALLNSLTVEQNVALGLTEHGHADMDEVRKLVDEKLALVDMEGTNRLMPEELSGGMKKRVAVARTLALDPEIILFDEPTVGLDPMMSNNVDELIIGLKARVRCTNVVVSHDMITAFRVGDRIGMFHDGHIIGVDTPRHFRDSTEQVVQDFIGRNIHWRF